MELNNDLIMQFAKIAKINTKNKDATTVRGVIRNSGDRNYIQIDGADEGSKTPVETTVEISDGDRVIAAVKDHSVIVTGNKSNPSIGVKTADGLRSSITQTAKEIRAEVADEVSGLNSTITQTAKDIRAEVADEVNGLNSTITQTAKEIRTEISDTASNLNSTITQTAKEINTRIDNIDTSGDGVSEEEFTEFKQTVEGFYFIDENGTVYIDGGSVYADNLNLTGAITWSDLSSGAKNTINSSVNNAYDHADDAYNKAVDAETRADNAYILAEAALNNSGSANLPDYIKETYIDSTTIKSPNIIGGYMYAVGSDPNYASTFTRMDENGFYLYHNSDTPDNDSSVYPKICLSCDDDGDKVYCILGSGSADNSMEYNRFYIEKTSSYVALRYVRDYNGNFTGLTFSRDGTLCIDATDITGFGGVFPIGYIYLSYDDSESPASRFGGSWSRLNGYFLYAGGSNATMGDTGSVVTAGGTNSAEYIKIAAWRRVS